MRKLLIVLAAVVLTMSACQKELSQEDHNIPPGTSIPPPEPLGLLTRTVFVSGSDSLANDYGYDAAKRLVTVDVKTNGINSRFTRIVRNQSGIMTQFVLKSEDLISEGIDSMVTFVQYDITKAQYTQAVAALVIRGVPYRDSTVFIYNQAGNLTVKMSHSKIGTAPYTLDRKTEYSYTAGNVTTEKYYSMDLSNEWELYGTYTYSYDSRVNPLKLGEEAMIALDDGTFFSLNNVSVMDYTDSSDPAYNFALSTTYTYNADNKPAGATVTENPGSSTYTLRYYYN